MKEPEAEVPEAEVSEYEVEVIRDAFDEPYPEAVQRLAGCVLPTPGYSANDLINAAIRAAVHWEQSRPKTYSCNHCHDGKDLPEGYVCQRCGADNPSPGTW